MKKHLIGILFIALLVTACSSSEPQKEESAAVTGIAPVQTSDLGVARTTATGDTSALAEAESADIPQMVPKVNQLAVTNTPYPTFTPYPTYTPYATYTPYPTATPPPTNTLTPVETITQTPVKVGVDAPTPTDTPTETPVATPNGPTQTLPIQSAPAPYAVTLTRIQDTDPAPPLAIVVSKIQVEQNGNYKLTGTVRNDGSQTYGGIGVIATFYEAEKPCVEREVKPRTWPGAPTAQARTVDVCQYNWHGPVKVYAACQLLAPGTECPFSLEIYGRDYVSYLLHPEGTPVDYRQPASLTLSGLNVTNNGLGYVRISGTATNQNPFAVRNANVIGTLLDAAGQIVSLGTAIVPGEIPPGASLPFDLRIEYAPYARYELYGQATHN